ncbi:hypothetical protein SAMN02910370_02169 [Lachnospiraceae bacterium XPB1003]|nr:hypothetical protein SAMN02910370_02169 [Lachnospiraceae bacterium XPB1003]
MEGGRFYDETEDAVRVKDKENEVAMVRLVKSNATDIEIPGVCELRKLVRKELKRRYREYE